MSSFVAIVVLASVASAGTVKYLDADGTEQSVTEYTLVNADSATAVTWPAGTYVVGADYNSDGEINAADATYAQAQEPQLSTSFTITGGATAGGNVKLILADGFTLTLDASAGEGYGFDGNYKTINIYGQSGQSGTLIAKGGSNDGDGAHGLGGSWNINLNGGIVKAYGGDATEEDYFGGSGMYGAYINHGTVYGYGGKGLGCGPGGVGLESCEIYNDAVVYGFGGDGGDGDNGGDGVAMTMYDVPDTIEVHGTGGNGVCGGNGISFEDEAAGSAFYGIGGNGTTQGGAGIYIDCSKIDAGTFMAVGGKGETGGEGLLTGDGLVFSGGTLAITGGVGTVTGGCGISGGSITLAGSVIEVVAGAGAAGVAIDGTVHAPKTMIIIHGASAATAVTLVRTEETDITGDIEGDAYVKSTPPPPETASTVVTTLEDVDDKFDGKISLREAITYADDTLGYDITFSSEIDWAAVHPSLTISLARTIEFEKDVTIDGTLKTGEATVGKVTLDGGNARRIMSDDKSDCVLTIRNMDFRNGKTSYGGGAINADGTVILANATFENNQESNYGGGAVCATSGITADNCTFRGNNGASGGAIAVKSSGLADMILTNCIFVRNTSKSTASTGRGGGAICFQSGGKLVSVNSTFFGNSAARKGGAIYAESGAVLTLVNNTITGNAASLGGDAIYLKNGSATLVNSILVGNAIARYASETITGYGVNVVDAASASLVTTAEDGSVTRTATKTEVFGTETPAAGPDGQVTVLANAKTEGVYVYGGASVAAALAWSTDGVTKNYINGTTGADTRLNPADRIRDSKVYAGVGVFPAAYTIVLSEGEAYRDVVASANKITAQVAAQGLTYVDGRWLMDGFAFITSAETGVRFADAANAVSVVSDSSVAGGRYGFYLDGSLELSGPGSVSAGGAEAGVFGTVTSEPYATAKSGETNLAWQKVNAEEPGFYAYTSGDPAVAATSVALTARPPLVVYRDFVDGGFVTAPLTNDYTLIKSDASASVTWSAGIYVVGDDYNMDGIIDYRDAEYAAENGLPTTFNYNGAIVEGAVKLVLVDGFTLTSKGGSGKAGVRVAGNGNSFTVYGQANGTGRLNATGGTSSAGIGSTSRTSKNGDAANITINGGTVTATGGNYGAGIGGGQETSASNITINAGTVIANGKGGGAGIGGGGNANFVQGVSHGSFITITGGKVTAASDGYAAAIGGGRSGRGRDIRITGGEVIANGGYFEKTSIGNGAKTNGVTTEPATNIFVDAQLILKADGNNPPKTLIAHASDTDLSATLKGLRYVTAKDTAVARAGATKYYTLQDALAAGDGKVIELLLETNEDCALSTAAGTTNIVDAMGLRYSNSNALTNDGTLTLANSAATEVQFAFGSVVNRGEITMGHLTDGEPLLVVDGAFSGADGKIVVDMSGANETTYKLISATEASDYGTTTCRGDYVVRMIGNDLYAIHMLGLTFEQSEGGEFTVSTNGGVIASGAPVPAGDIVSLAFTPSNTQWQIDTDSLQLKDATNGIYDVSYFSDVSLAGAKFAMPVLSAELSVAFKISDMYREYLLAVAKDQHVQAGDSIDALYMNRLTHKEIESFFQDIYDVYTTATNDLGEVYRPYEGDAVTNGLAASLAEIVAKAKAASDAKPYDLVIANDFTREPFENIVTNENGKVVAFTFDGIAYTNGVNAFSSFSEAAAEEQERYVPFTTNVHVFGNQTIADVPTMRLDWTLDLVTCETEPGVTNAAIVTVAKTATGALVQIPEELKAITGEGAIVLSVTNGTADAAAYKTALEGLIGAADVSVAYVNVEAERTDETGPSGEPVVSQEVTVTDDAKPEDAGEIVIPGVDTDGRVVIDVKPGVTNDVVVAGKLSSREWDVVIVNETTNTLTVGAIAAKLNVLITNVTEVGKILTLENVIAGQKIKIDNNGHLEANVYATESLEIRNAAVNTLVGTYRSGGPIDITGVYGSLSNVVIDATGTLTMTGTNVITGPVTIKAPSVANNGVVTFSVANDNRTTWLNDLGLVNGSGISNVGDTGVFCIKVDAEHTSGDLVGRYVIASNAECACESSGGTGAFTLTGDPSVEGQIIHVASDWFEGDIEANTLYVGAKAFSLYRHGVDVDGDDSFDFCELVFEVSHGKFAISYDAMGGTWPDGNSTSNVDAYVNRGYAFPAVNPVRENYTFAGWYRSWTNGAERVTETNVSESAVLPLNGHSLWAKWTPVSTKPTDKDIAVQDIVSGQPVLAIAAGAYAQKPHPNQAFESFATPIFLRSIGDNAFQGASALKKLVITEPRDYANASNKVTLTIGKQAFATCSALEEIRIPEGVTSIGVAAFMNCGKLKRIVFTGTRNISYGLKALYRCGYDNGTGALKVYMKQAFKDNNAALLTDLANWNTTVSIVPIVDAFPVSGGPASISATDFGTLGADRKVAILVKVPMEIPGTRPSASAVAVKHSATLDGSWTPLTPTSSESSDDGTVLIEVSMPDGASGFLKVELN